MKYLFLLLLFSSLCLANSKKVDEPFSETLYRESGFDTFLYVCEKTADCLRVDAGWSAFDKVHGDGIFHCYLHGEIKGSKDLDIDNYDKLLTMLARCRANSMGLLENK